TGDRARASAAAAVRIPRGDLSARPPRRGQGAGHALLRATSVAGGGRDAEEGLTLVRVVARQPVADRATRSVAAGIRRHAVAGPAAAGRTSPALGTAPEPRAPQRLAAARADAVTVAASFAGEAVAALVADGVAAHGGV